MTTWPFRIVASLLCINLVADPAWASRHSLPAAERGGPYNSQALIAPLEAGFERLQSTFGLKQRFELVAWAVDASGLMPNRWVGSVAYSSRVHGENLRDPHEAAILEKLDKTYSIMKHTHEEIDLLVDEIEERMDKASSTTEILGLLKFYETLKRKSLAAGALADRLEASLPRVPHLIAKNVRMILMSITLLASLAGSLYGMGWTQASLVLSMTFLMMAIQDPSAQKPLYSDHLLLQRLPSSHDQLTHIVHDSIYSLITKGRPSDVHFYYIDRDIFFADTYILGIQTLNEAAAAGVFGAKELWGTIINRDVLLIGASAFLEAADTAKAILEPSSLSTEVQGDKAALWYALLTAEIRRYGQENPMEHRKIVSDLMDVDLKGGHDHFAGAADYFSLKKPFLWMTLYPKRQDVIRLMMALLPRKSVSILLTLWERAEPSEHQVAHALSLSEQLMHVVLPSPQKGRDHVLGLPSAA